MAEVQPLKKPPGLMGTNVQNRAPPRKPALPPAFYNMKKKKCNCFRLCCCFLCCLFINFIIFAGIGTGIFFLCFQPKFPTFKFKSVEMDKFNVQIKDKTPLLTTHTTIKVEIKNNNQKLPIYYGKTGVSLTASEETPLGYGEIGGFKQAVNNLTVLKFELKVENEKIDEKKAENLNEKMKNEQVVVDAMVKTKVGFGVGDLKIGMVPVSVKCSGLNLKQINGPNSSPQCSVSVWGWIVAH